MLNTISTNYELSKKLKDLGFNQDTELYWSNEKGEQDYFLYVKHTWSENPSHVKAYTLEQILKALPEDIKFRDHNSEFGFQEGGLKLMCICYFEIGYYDANDSAIYDCEQKDDESLADTAARLLILLHEKGIKIPCVALRESESINKE